MIDYGPGDEIVCIKDDLILRALGIYKSKTYFCVDITLDSRPAVACSECGDTRHDIKIKGIKPNKHYGACICDFRKKLDFKSLCNVKDEQKIKEDA